MNPLKLHVCMRTLRSMAIAVFTSAGTAVFLGLASEFASQSSPSRISAMVGEDINLRA